MCNQIWDNFQENECVYIHLTSIFKLNMNTVGYREKGYPKQDPKNDCLDFVKIETS